MNSTILVPTEHEAEVMAKGCPIPDYIEGRSIRHAEHELEGVLLCIGIPV